MNAGMLQRKWTPCLLILPCLFFVAIRVSERRKALNDSASAAGLTSNPTILPGPLLLPTNGSVDSLLQSATTTATQSGTGNQSEIPNTEKTIYVITPTYRRATQMPDMTRLAQTLQLAALKYGSIFWIVSEDATAPSGVVTEILTRSGLPHVHVLGPRPVTHQDKRSGRGVSNRLRGLKWLRENLSNTEAQGVIYFADDDNSYDIRVFKEMKETKSVSVWPVGMIAKIGLSTPVVRDGQVVGFHDPFIARRKFAVDMGGFAVDLQLFLSRVKATMPYKVGYEEDMFLRSLGVKMSDMEPKANNCTEVLVWHTKTMPGVFPSLPNIEKEISPSVKNSSLTNLPLLYSNILNSPSNT